MIHHVSIPAREPRLVAEALRELLDGRLYPFPPHWCRDAYQVVSGDAHGTVLEVYPEGYWLEPIDSIFKKTEPVPFHPFHMLVSLPVDGAVIERVAAREGWKNDFIAVGTPGCPPAFHCYRMWVENRVLFEFVPQSMIHEYESYMQFGRLDEMRPKEVAAA